MLRLPRKALVAYNRYTAGLGNRVRVTMGAANLAEHVGRGFYYVWPTGEKFEPRFDELWDWDRGTVVPRAASRALAKVPGCGYVESDLVGLQGRESSPLWQIRTGGELSLPDEVRSWRADFRRLTPVDKIAATATGIFDEHFRGRPYVGVMIRAHQVSLAKTLETSPVQWFEERMRVLREQNPDLGFYVSCDVQEIQDRIVAAFPGSYGQRDKGPYNSTRAVRAAVVDLYLLASSSYTLGPNSSSFIHLADYLHDFAITTERPLSDLPAQPDLTSVGLVTDPLRPTGRAPRP